MPLVDPLPADHSAEVAQVARFFESTLGFPPNSVLTMQRRPEIAKAFTHLNRAVMDNGGRVTSEQKRLIGHLASANAGCRYCEAHTALAAKRFGASDERLAALWAFRDSPLFTEAEKAAFEFALAASSVPNAVDAAIGGELRRHWSDDEIVEILGVVSLFGFLNRWNDSMGTTLEGEAADVAAEHLARRGWQAGKHRTS
ncbi:MAG TPA: carboxymuconolactone decarboxylase family protein [Rubrivivax sp.]|nr:carboxymuconolactone decarboxylase family protein [Rubrivivax sp.]